MPAERRGTYLGILDRLEVLRAAGATAVLITPSLMLGGPSASQFGGSPLSLFAPETALCAGGPANAANEVKELIKGLHAAGIEAYMQVRPWPCAATTGYMYRLCLAIPALQHVGSM